VRGSCSAAVSVPTSMKTPRLGPKAIAMTRLQSDSESL
jgi:hypothetical protein